MEQEKTLAKQHQPLPLSLLVKQQISSMTSQRRTNSITEVGTEASKLREQTPSAIMAAYSIDLQDSATAAFPTVDIANDVPSPKLGVMSEAFPAHTDQRTGAEVKDMAVVWMQSQLIAVSMFCGAREKMTDWQSNSLCNQIINEHPALTLMEFILFCARLRSSRYGKFYGAIDPAAILGALDLFLQDRGHDIRKRKEEEERIAKEKEMEEHRKRAITYEQWQEIKRRNETEK